MDTVLGVNVAGDSLRLSRSMTTLIARCARLETSTLPAPSCSSRPWFRRLDWSRTWCDVSNEATLFSISRYNNNLILLCSSGGCGKMPCWWLSTCDYLLIPFSLSTNILFSWCNLNRSNQMTWLHFDYLFILLSTWMSWQKVVPCGCLTHPTFLVASCVVSCESIQVSSIKRNGNMSFLSGGKSRSLAGFLWCCEVLTSDAPFLYKKCMSDRIMASRWL